MTELFHFQFSLFNHKGFDLVISAWSRGFPYFLQFKSEFCNMELITWATASSQSCFCWLHRTSSSLAAKNIINLILVLTIWWCPCVESSVVFLEENVSHDQCILLVNSIRFFLFHFVLQGQTCLILQVSPDFLFSYSNPLWFKGHPFFLFVCLFLMLFLDGLVSLHRIIQLQLLWH